MIKKTFFIFCGLFLGVCFLVSGCSVTRNTSDETKELNQENDPLEPLNRGVFEFNQVADKLVLKPVAKGYRFLFPDFVRKSVINLFITLKQPAYFANSLLQGNPKEALYVLERTGVNLSVGCLGLFDVATEMDIPAPDADFGQTLAKWGWKNEGPFIMLPLIGPSNPRDAIGYGADALANPLDWRLRHEPLLVYGMTAAEGFAKRERALEMLDNLERSSTDYYAAMRTMYRQNRQKKIDSVLPKEEQAPKSYEFDFEIDEEDE